MMNGTLFSPTSSLTLESPLLEDGQTLMHQFCTQEQREKAFTILDQKRIQQTILLHFTPGKHGAQLTHEREI